MPRAVTLSSRNAKGRGWHKKGYREDGELWIQLKRGTYGFSRGHSVNEKESISNCVDAMYRDIRTEDGYCHLPEGFYIDFQFHRKSLDPESQEMVKSLLDGGETVYAKVFDAMRRDYREYGLTNREVQEVPGDTMNQVRSRSTNS